MSGDENIQRKLRNCQNTRNRKDNRQFLQGPTDLAQPFRLQAFILWVSKFIKGYNLQVDLNLYQKKVTIATFFK